ncbi:hypothetical protein L1887_10753 [Cichorium endivia]|nr:hypothetical protein L1887_10753 [Cichorium endivia]
MKTQMTGAFVVGTVAFMMAFSWLFSRRQPTPRWFASKLPSKCNKRTLKIAVEKECNVVFDCIVCLYEVSQEEDYRKLPNCNHGIQFHAHCIDTWLKNHTTCPMCRSHIPQPLSQRLSACVSRHLFENVISYCDTALDNVARSIVQC